MVVTIIIDSYRIGIYSFCPNPATMMKHDTPYFTQNALPESNKITGISSFLLVRIRNAATKIR
jgi:hypothetical protein